MKIPPKGKNRTNDAELKWMKEACEKWIEQDNALVKKIHELQKKKLNPDLSFEEIAKINFEIDALIKEMCSIEHPFNND